MFVLKCALVQTITYIYVWISKEFGTIVLIGEFKCHWKFHSCSMWVCARVFVLKCAYVQTYPDNYFNIYVQISKEFGAILLHCDFKCHWKFHSSSMWVCARVFVLKCALVQTCPDNNFNIYVQISKEFGTIVLHCDFKCHWKFHSSSMWVCACVFVLKCALVQTCPDSNCYGFQKNLAQLFSLVSSSTIWEFNQVGQRSGVNRLDKFLGNVLVFICFQLMQIGIYKDKKPWRKTILSFMEHQGKCASESLTHYHTMMHFDTLKICRCGKHCVKSRNCL